MKILLVGVGQIGLGLIVPVFTKAGYNVIGTDANEQRLLDLQGGYFLETPKTKSKFNIATIGMDAVADNYYLIVTSVGRQHLKSVAEWYSNKKLFAPVLLAENLPDHVQFFPKQMPIVVDRICPRIVSRNGTLSVIAEDYYKIVCLADSLTNQLGTVKDVELETSEGNVELKRKQKMFTVNTAHVVTALYGQRLGCEFVEEAISKKEVVEKVNAMLYEVAKLFGFDDRQVADKIKEITKRFSSQIKDKLTRILNPTNCASATRYVEIPLRALNVQGIKAPALAEASQLLSKIK